MEARELSCGCDPPQASGRPLWLRGERGSWARKLDSCGHRGSRGGWTVVCGLPQCVMTPERTARALPGMAVAFQESGIGIGCVPWQFCRAH